jgi:hypothetical protein
MWIAVLIIGVLLSILMPISIRRGMKSKAWPEVRATVKSAEVEERHEYDEDGEHIYHYPRIHYDYQVGEQVFSGSKYKLLDSSMSKRKAFELISHFRKGDIITAHYNPGKPEESVLLTGAQTYLYVFLIIGIGLTILGIVKLLI